MSGHNVKHGIGSTTSPSGDGSSSPSGDGNNGPKAEKGRNKVEMKDKGVQMAGNGNGQQEGDGNTTPTQIAGVVPYFSLYRLADPLDYLFILLGTLGAVAAGSAFPVFFLFFGELIDRLGKLGTSADPDALSKEVNKYILYFVYLGAAMLVAVSSELFFWGHTAERQSAKIRLAYLKAALSQEIGYFDIHSGTGDIVSRISNDVVIVQEAIGQKVGLFIQFVSAFVFGFSMGFVSSWKLAVIILAVAPGIIGSGALYAYFLGGVNSKSQMAYAGAGNIVLETLSSIRTVYSFVGEERASSLYSKALEVTCQLGIQGGFVKGIGMGVTYGVLFCTWALIFWRGSHIIADKDGGATPGKVLTTMFNIIIGGMSLGQALPYVSNFLNGKTAGYKVFETISREPLIKSNEKSGQIISGSEFRGNIELRDIAFAYPARPDAQIFRGLCLMIPAGKTAALVGSSGSGKSTVVGLIERFYEPSAGQVLIDGLDIKTLQLKWLRRQIGLVSQEPALFATTIMENIMYGKDGATREEVMAAAKAANAYKFITEFPDGFDTQVGESGLQMSGGQKQRIAIARAVLKNPCILLLDEATSALDSESERVVQEALDSLMVGRTTVVVAHRLSTIRNADKIVVIQAGEVVEEGSHKELMKKEGMGGAYVALIQMQNAAKEKKDAPIALSKSMDRKDLLKSLSRGGRLSFSYSHLSEGSAADMVGTVDADGRVVQSPSLRRLIQMNGPEWKWGLLGVVGSIGSGFYNPSFAYLLSNVIAKFFDPDAEKMKEEVLKRCWIFLGLGGSAFIVYAMNWGGWGGLGEKLVKRVREQSFISVVRQEIGWFDRDENSSGAIAARLETDVTIVKTAVADRLAVFMTTGAVLVISFGISFWKTWKVALVALSVFPILLLGNVAQAFMMKGTSADARVSYASAANLAAEAVVNIRTVQAFSAEDKILQLFRKHVMAPLKDGLFMAQTTSAVMGLSQGGMYASFALIMWYGMKLVKSRDINFDAIFTVFMVTVVASFAVAEVLSLAPDIMKGSDALAAVFSTIDRQTAIDPDSETAVTLPKIDGMVELRKVRFHYPSRPDVQVFSDFSLKINPGQTVALVGASGSGKSSVIALIERFYDPISGSVLVDGKDIRKLNLKWLRGKIGLVSQEPSLFDRSIKSNILFGREGAQESEVVEAAKAANAHGFISAFPAGYETSVGERGVQMSGGQKQRIAIARAVLKNPRILLLDEATSALDTESERVVQDALDHLMVGRTTVVVAHRLSTIRNADVIAVVEKGVIVEQGNHAALMAKAGAYAALISLQGGGGGGGGG